MMWARNYQQMVSKGGISLDSSSGVVFTDGTEEALTDVLLCTGI